MQEIRTHKLVLVDQQDAPRITLEVTPDGAAELSFTDAKGNERLRLSVSDNGEGSDTLVQLQSTNSGPVVNLKTSPDGSAALMLMRRAEHPLAILEVESGEDSRPCLTLYDPSEKIPLNDNGKLRWPPTALVYLTVTEEPEAYMQFLTPEGSHIQRLPD